MKYFCIMSSVLLFAFAANAEFVRKEKRPDFFVPESVYNQKTALGPIVYKKPDTKSDAHVATRKVDEKKNTSKTSSDKKIVNPKKKKTKEKMFEPEYQKVYDKYHKNLLKYKSSKRMPKDPELEKDLAKMNSDEVFEVKD